MKKTYKGLQENIKELKLPRITTWKNKYSDKEFKVKCETSEFSCICPKTGLPDYARIIVEYSPAKTCIELKSFKEYLFSYRDLGIFHEHVVNKITEDIVNACTPNYLKVTGIFNVRGGITTTVEREYSSC